MASAVGVLFFLGIDRPPTFYEGGVTLLDGKHLFALCCLSATRSHTLLCFSLVGMQLRWLRAATP